MEPAAKADLHSTKACRRPTLRGLHSMIFPSIQHSGKHEPLQTVRISHAQWVPVAQAAMLPMLRLPMLGLPRCSDTPHGRGAGCDAPHAAPPHARLAAVLRHSPWPETSMNGSGGGCLQGAVVRWEGQGVVGKRSDTYLSHSPRNAEGAVYCWPVGARLGRGAVFSFCARYPNLKSTAFRNSETCREKWLLLKEGRGTCADFEQGCLQRLHTKVVLGHRCIAR